MEAHFYFVFCIGVKDFLSSNGNGS